MFCPSCGLEERQTNQFCRACGANLNFVRTALAKPDTITDSAAAARTEIGRTVASKITELKSAKDLKKIAEDVLPEIEKFLESPAEKRMRRIRTGTIISSVGLGAAIAFTVVSAVSDEKLIVLAGFGLVAFFIGLSFVINGLLFTVPKKTVSDKSLEADHQRELDGVSAAPTNELVLPEAQMPFASVTEETTRHLKDKQAIPRK